MAKRRPRVAIVHDVLGSRAGGERVAVALASVFPDAPLHTMLFEPAATFDGIDPGRIQTSWLNRSRFARQNYRQALPLVVAAARSTSIDADVVICSTSGLSHHVRASGHKIVYCHTPARWLHDPSAYMQAWGTSVRLAAGLIRAPLQSLDRRSMQRASQILVNSEHIGSEVREIYGRDATVIAPVSSLDIHGPVSALDGVEPGFVFAPVRPLGYKRLDVLVDAARQLPATRFLHVGGGPHRDKVLTDLPPNLKTLGVVSDAELRWAYRNAACVALTCAEDYGLVPDEAAAHGLDAIVPGARGFNDPARSDLIRYDFGSVDSLVAAISASTRCSPQRQLDSSRLGRDRFANDMRACVESWTAPVRNHRR